MKKLWKIGWREGLLENGSVENRQRRDHGQMNKPWKIATGKTVYASRIHQVKVYCIVAVTK